MSDASKIAILLLLAALLDLGVMLWLRRVQSWRTSGQAEERKVRLFGVYSPVLTWLQGGGESTAGEGQAPEPSAKWRWLEWLAILASVTFFCWGILDFRAITNLPGNEAEIFQTLDWTLVNSLRNYHAFPLWNPYLMSGIPYVGDPMLHIYNPLVTLPVLLFGVRAGFKLALYLSFLAGAFGMWRLGSVLGMRSATRLWIALMFAFAGQPVARFFQGQYLFVLGFAWIPWIISSLIQVIRFHRARDIALAVVSMALLFFSGNAYYPFFILNMLLLFGLVMLPRLLPRKPFISLHWQATLSFIFVGVMVLGVIAIQLLPLAEFSSRLSKDMKLEGSHTLEQIFLDYTSKDTYRPDAYSQMPAREEFYAYIGLIPFFSLALLPLAFWKHDRKLILYFVLVLSGVLLWISVEHLPWFEFFVKFDWLRQFRHLLRSLVIGSFAIIVLAGFGLDALWTALQNNAIAAKRDGSQGKTQLVLVRVGLGLMGLLMLLGVWEVFDTNQQYLRTVPVYQPALRVMRWVRNNDLGDYYTRHNPNNTWHQATISNNLRYLSVWYHFADIRSLDGAINRRQVIAQPQYLTQSMKENNPKQPDAQQLAIVEDHVVYELTESLPMAFQVSHAELEKGDEAGPLLRQHVTPLLPVFSSTGRLDVIAEGHGNETLVVLISHYPGWVVRMDGEQGELLNVGGYLAVDLPPGPHQFEFVYRPRSFYTGLVISLLATLVTALMLLRQLPLSRRHRQEALQDLQTKLGMARARLAAWWHTLLPNTVQTVYREGALHPATPLDLPEQAELTVTLVSASPRLIEMLRDWLWASGRLVRGLFHITSLETGLFVLALLVYLLTRLIRLTDFPIYFFTDEAIQSLSAYNLLHNGLRGPDNTLLPTYFQNGSYFNLSLSVYLQALPVLLFGKSVFVTRLVSVLVSLLGGLAIGMILRDIFKVRYWWAGTLLLSITPAWFLHSRTAFETVIFVSLYAVMFYAYLLYRYRSTGYLFLALIMAALAFYSYSPGQLIVGATWLLFLLSDLPYHWKNRRMLPGLLGLLFVLALPYLRFRFASEFDPEQHLRILGSYWLQPITLGEKLKHFSQEYLRALSPAYWFFPNEHDLARHLMKGYGHVSRYLLPFAALGLVRVLWHWRFSAYRNTLLILLVAPLSSALVGIGITRVLVTVIPLVLFIALGLELALNWFEKGILIVRKNWQPQRVYTWLSVWLVFGLSWSNFAMLGDALTNGPRWYQDYTLGGMQYGARQLYAEVLDYLEQNPTQRLVISPNWTNGADTVTSFFLPPGLPVQMGSIEGYLYQHLQLDENTVLVMMPEEFDKANASGKFQDIEVLRTLYYPNGQPGFLFVTLRYVEDVDALLAQEREARKVLQEDQIALAGQQVSVSYSQLDMGTIQHIFDGDQYTLARSFEANPFIIDLSFPQPVTVSGLNVTTGSANVQVNALLYSEQASDPVSVSGSYHGTISEPGFSLDFGQTLTVTRLRLEILEPGVGEPAHVHVWEIELK